MTSSCLRFTEYGITGDASVTGALQIFTERHWARIDVTGHGRALRGRAQSYGAWQSVTGHDIALQGMDKRYSAWMSVTVYGRALPVLANLYMGMADHYGAWIIMHCRALRGMAERYGTWLSVTGHGMSR